MATTTAEISRLMRLVKNQDPKRYDQFLSRFEAHVAEVTVAVTEAPPDQILVCQGRAQEAIKIFRLFTELPEDTSSPGP